jgi:hypothetical protein
LVSYKYENLSSPTTTETYQQICAGTLPPITQTIPDTQYTSLDNYNNSHPIFNDTTIAQIHLTMPVCTFLFLENLTFKANYYFFAKSSTLAFMLDPVNQETEDYYPVDFWFYNGAVTKTYDQVGFRLKGGFSRKYVKVSFFNQ